MVAIIFGLIISILLSLVLLGNFNILFFLLFIIFSALIYFLYIKSNNSSNKVLWRTITFTIIFLAIIFILNAIGLLVFLNKPLNNIVAGEPDVSCVLDSDCKIKKINCHPCYAGKVVNKDWRNFCPFRDAALYNCGMLAPRPEFPKCINNKCELVWKDEENNILDCDYACYNAGYDVYGNCMTEEQKDRKKDNYVDVGDCLNKEEKCFCLVNN